MTLVLFEEEVEEDDNTEEFSVGSYVIVNYPTKKNYQKVCWANSETQSSNLKKIFFLNWFYLA